ncbi:MAG TPA: hypothetical protein VGD27_11115 [Longimicrobiales bacterium]
MSLFEELRRRKVIRAVLGYGAAAFIAAQVTQLLVDALDLDPWILKAVVILAIVALPFVIGLAWAFDASREGVHLTSDRSTSASSTFPWRRLAVPLSASLVLLLAAFVIIRTSSSKSLNQNLVAVLPFHVSGDPQIAYLHEGMVDLLAAKLTGEGGPRAADPRGVMSVVRQQVSDDADLSEKNALRIARDVGTGQVLVGSIVGTPAQFTIHARLLRVPGGRVLVEAEQRGSADSLLYAVDQLVAKLLSLQAGEGPQRLDQLMTTSLPALRAYLDGKVAYRSGHFGRASEMFAQAIEIDSTFALAAIGQFMTTGWGEGPRVDRAKARRTLIANRDRLGKIDHAIAVAMYGENPGRPRTWRQRLSDWDRAVTLAPDHLDARFWFADFMFHYGSVADLDNPTERADEAFSRILKDDSTYVPALLHRIDVAIRLDRIDAIRQLEPLRKRLDPQETAAHYQRAKRIRLLGDSAAIAAERAALDTMSADALRNAAGGGGTTPGSVDDALRAIELHIRKAATRSDREDAYWDALDRYFMYGMPARAQAMAEQLKQLEENDVAGMQVLAAIYWDGDTKAGAGAAAEIEAALRNRPDLELQTWGACVLEHWRLWRKDASRYEQAQQMLAAVPADSAGLKVFADVCSATIATIRSAVFRESDLPVRVQTLNAIMREGPTVPAFMLNISNIVLGRAAEQIGDRRLAQRAFSRYPGGDLETLEFATTMMRELARLAAINGDRELAVRIYRRYLLLHERAEPSVRRTDDAVRQQFERLVGERGN